MDIDCILLCGEFICKWRSVLNQNDFAVATFEIGLTMYNRDNMAYDENATPANFVIVIF
jgi:hypothetical protein